MKNLKEFITISVLSTLASFIYGFVAALWSTKRKL